MYRHALRLACALERALIRIPQRLPKVCTGDRCLVWQPPQSMFGVVMRHVGSSGNRVIPPNPATIALRRGKTRFSTPHGADMRKADDIALRARNWLWYCMVRGTHDVPNEQLDKKFMAARGGRVRFFQRIQDSASSPDEIPVLGGKTLLEVVGAADRVQPDQPGPFAPATTAFRSKFWDFLTSRVAPPQVYTDFIQSYANTHGWIRLANADFAVYETFLGRDEPAIEDHIGTAYSAMLHKLANDATLDATAVLIALFREALSNVDLKRAVAVNWALDAALDQLCRIQRFPGLLTTLLFRLVNDRVSGNTWLTKADWRAATNAPVAKKPTSRQRVAEFHAWVSWYISRARPDRVARYGQLPIVPRSARVDWVESNKDQLVQVDRKVRDLWSFDFKLDDEESRRQVAEAKREADALVARFQCPFDTREAFYDHEPRLTIADLPKCYPTTDTDPQYSLPR